MVRTFAFVFLLVGALGAIGDAQNMRNFESANFRNPRTVGGQVNRDGSVARGSHFTVTYLGTGQYELNFDSGYFRSGCPILTVTPIQSALTTYYVYPKGCRTYDVYFRDGQRFVDTPFDLIAVASE